jgi:hypothetical protein
MRVRLKDQFELLYLFHKLICHDYFIHRNNDFSSTRIYELIGNIDMMKWDY